MVKILVNFSDKLNKINFKCIEAKEIESINKLNEFTNSSFLKVNKILNNYYSKFLIILPKIINYPEIYTKTIESNENIDKMIQELQEKFKFLANKTQIYLDLLNKNELLETLANDLSINLKNKIELLSHLISLLKLNITWYQKIEPLLVS